MLRNREAALWLAGSAAGTLLCTLVGLLFSLEAGLCALAAGCMTLGAGVLFTHWRYEEIRRLSEALRRICAGDTRLDLRSYAEGELSILHSELYKVTRMLTEQREELCREKTRLADGISDISHQLKTPMTSLSVMTDLLEREDLTEQRRREFIQSLRSQLERMEWLLSALLKLSRIDAGAVQFARSPVRVQELVEAAARPLQIPMDIRNQRLVLQGEPGATLRGDFAWSREALVNILKNCVEHTPEGGQVQVCWSENPLYTELVVTDTGPGIPREELPHIFRRFYRGKNAQADSVGIGLALARSILTGQGGDLTAESPPEGGAKFILRFVELTV